MIKEVYIPKGTVYLYDDNSNRYPYPNTVARTVTVLEETKEWFKVTYKELVGTPYAWIKKVDIGYQNPVSNNFLETGDTMVLSDKNGVRIGVWTFKKG